MSKEISSAAVAWLVTSGKIVVSRWARALPRLRSCVWVSCGHDNLSLLITIRECDGLPDDTWNVRSVPQMC